MATVNQSLKAKTETTATIEWSANAEIDALWYSTDDGSTWVALEAVTGSYKGSYQITGLTPGATYSVKTRIRRMPMQGVVMSAALSVTTYDYPFAQAMPDFTIGENKSFGIYNPLGRSVTYQMLAADGSVFASGSSSKGTANFDTADCQDTLYASIPDASRGQYSAAVTYQGHTTTKTGGYYSVNTSVCKPSVENFYYQDVNEDMLEITENSRHIVQKLSKMQVTVTGIQAHKYASIVSCVLKVNGITKNMPIEDGTAVGDPVALDSSTNLTATLIITDSRGVSISRNFTVLMIVWSAPSAIIAIQRKNNFYSQTTITVNADFSPVEGKNSIEIICLARREIDNGFPISWELENNVPFNVQLDNNYDWEIAVVIEDVLGGKTEYRRQVSRGTPIIFFDRLKSSVGINCFPKDEKSLEVNGINIERSVMTRSISAEFTEMTASSYGEIPFDLDISAGSKFTAADDGGIIVGANVSRVLVSGQMLAVNLHPDRGNFYLCIVKNSYTAANVLAMVQAQISHGDAASLVIPPVLAEAAEGDVIYAMCRGKSPDDMILGGFHGSRTCLTVETIG